MTNFILIRHGEPDYSLINQKNFKGHGCDLAFLTREGEKQAEMIANNELLKNAELLISSPYTRCMQTAAIISNKIGLPIKGELDLHEWLPDLSFNYQTSSFAKNNYKKAINDYLNNQITSNEYESIQSVKKRVLNVFKKYLEYEKVIIVTHGGVMYSLTEKKYLPCEMESIEYDGKKLIKKTDIR